MLRLPRSTAACPAGRYTIGFNRNMMHCSQLEWGPKFFKMGTKWGPNFEVNGDQMGTFGSGNGDQMGTKWGPKKRIFDKLTGTC